MRRNLLKTAAAILILWVVALGQTSEKSMREKLTVKKALNLAVAKEIATAAESEARRNNWNVSIAIVDEAGRLLYFQRMDETTNASVEVAIAKAVHSANYRRDTKFHEELLSKGNNVVLGLPNSLPVEGGVRLIVDEKVIGAIGVSGAQSPQDGQIAKAGADLLSK